MKRRDAIAAQAALQNGDLMGQVKFLRENEAKMIESGVAPEKIQAAKRVLAQKLRDQGQAEQGATAWGAAEGLVESASVPLGYALSAPEYAGNMFGERREVGIPEVPEAGGSTLGQTAVREIPRAGAELLPYVAAFGMGGPLGGIGYLAGQLGGGIGDVIAGTPVVDPTTGRPRPTTMADVAESQNPLSLMARPVGRMAGVYDARQAGVQGTEADLLYQVGASAAEGELVHAYAGGKMARDMARPAYERMFRREQQAPVVDPAVAAIDSEAATLASQVRDSSPELADRIEQARLSGDPRAVESAVAEARPVAQRAEAESLGRLRLETKAQLEVAQNKLERAQRRGQEGLVARYTESIARLTGELSTIDGKLATVVQQAQAGSVPGGPGLPVAGRPEATPRTLPPGEPGAGTADRFAERQRVLGFQERMARRFGGGAARVDTQQLPPAAAMENFRVGEERADILRQTRAPRPPVTDAVPTTSEPGGAPRYQGETREQFLARRAYERRAPAPIGASGAPPDYQPAPNTSAARKEGPARRATGQPVTREYNSELTDRNAPTAPAQVPLPDAEMVGSPKRKGVKGMGKRSKKVEPEVSAAPEPFRPGERAEAPAPVRSVAGRETAVQASGIPELRGRYEVGELEDMPSSHDPIRGFQRRPGFDQESQLRNYEKPESASRFLVEKNAREFDPKYIYTDIPTGEHGAPIEAVDPVSGKRQAVAGRGRLMTAELMYSDPAKAQQYRQALVENAPRFGIDPAQIASMKRPVLKRVVELPEAEWGRAGKAMDERVGGLSMTANEAAIGRGKLIGANTNAYLDPIFDVTTKSGSSVYESVRSIMSTAEEGGKLVDALIKDGAFTKEQKQALVTSEGKVTDAGKVEIENAFAGSIVRDVRLLDALPPSFRTKIASITGSVAKVRAKVPEMDPTPVLQEALETLQRNPTLETGLFDPTPIKPEVAKWAQAIRDLGPVKFREAMKQYAADVLDESQPKLFTRAELLGGAASAALVYAAWEGDDDAKTALAAFPLMFGMGRLRRAREMVERARSGEAIVEEVKRLPAAPPKPQAGPFLPPAGKALETLTGGNAPLAKIPGPWARLREWYGTMAGNPQFSNFLDADGALLQMAGTERIMRDLGNRFIQGMWGTPEGVKEAHTWWSKNQKAWEIPKKLIEKRPLTLEESRLYQTPEVRARVDAFVEPFKRYLQEVRDKKIPKAIRQNYYPRTLPSWLDWLVSTVGKGDPKGKSTGGLDIARMTNIDPTRNPIEVGLEYNSFVKRKLALNPLAEWMGKRRDAHKKVGNRTEHNIYDELLRQTVLDEGAPSDKMLAQVLGQDLIVENWDGQSFQLGGELGMKGTLRVLRKGYASERRGQTWEVEIDGQKWGHNLSSLELSAMKAMADPKTRWRLINRPMQATAFALSQAASWYVIAGNTRTFFTQIMSNVPRLVAGTRLMDLPTGAKAVLDYWGGRMSKEKVQELIDDGAIKGEPMGLAKQGGGWKDYLPMHPLRRAAFMNVAFIDESINVAAHSMLKKQLKAEHPDWSAARLRDEVKIQRTRITDSMSPILRAAWGTHPAHIMLSLFMKPAIREGQQVSRFIAQKDAVGMLKYLGLRGGALAFLIKYFDLDREEGKDLFFKTLPMYAWLTTTGHNTSRIEALSPALSIGKGVATAGADIARQYAYDEGGDPIGGVWAPRRATLRRALPVAARSASDIYNFATARDPQERQAYLQSLVVSGGRVPKSPTDKASERRQRRRVFRTNREAAR